MYQNVIRAIDHHLKGMSDDHLSAHAHKKGDHDHFVEELVHALIHIEDEKEALKFMKPAMDHLIFGWTNYILEDGEM